MDFKTYVKSVVSAYVEKQDQNVIFIKHYNTLDISEEDIISDVINTDDKTFLYHEYRMHEMHDAYSPFLEWIRECYDKYYRQSMSVEDFLKKSHVYPMHIEPMSCFLNGKACTRKEDVLYFEISFETERMLDDLIAILEFISKEHSLVMILSKFHLAPFSTIRLFRKLIERKLNIHAIILYNDEFNVAPYKKDTWESLLQKTAEQNLQLEWGSLDSERTMDVQDEFWFDREKMDEYIIMLSNMYFTFALEDASYYLNDILYRMDEKTIWLTKAEQLPFLQLAAMTDINLGSVNNALVICDKMTDMCANTEIDLINSYIYYLLTARARMILAQTNEVEYNCKKCIEIARKMGKEYLACKAEVLLWTLYFGIGKDIFEYKFRKEIDENVIKRAEKYGFMNFLAYINVFGFENDKKDLPLYASGEKEPEHFNLGIKIGTELENENFLLHAYMKNIILYTQEGYFRYVRKMYEKRLAVLKKPNPFRESHMYAGLGYNSIILEDYEKAHEYLIKSVITLTNMEKPDDVMNSLYNLAMNYYVAESYHNAIQVIDLILKMLREMGYQSIGASSNTKLFAIIAISCYYEGEFYNSYYFLSKMEIIVEHMLKVLIENHDGVWDEDLALYHLLKGMLYSHESRYDLAEKEYEEVDKALSRTTGSRFFIYPVLVMERSELYKKLGDKGKADTIVKVGIKQLEREGMLKKKARLEYYLENGERDKTPMMALSTKLPVKQMIQIARQEGAHIKLHKKENDIKFLTVLQEAISRENMTARDLYQNTAAVVKNSYNLDEIVILRRKDGKGTVIMYDGDEPPFSEAEANEIFDFFKEYKQAFLTNRSDKNFTQFSPIMEHFNEEYLMTMIGIPIIEQSGTETVFLADVKIKRRTVVRRAFLGGDDLTILKFAFSQFCEMMRRIDNRLMIENMNHKLEQSAITDHLTGITNRSGFSKQVERIISQDSSYRNVIVYLDLDNFKFYNDTFGHEIGDLVLVCFAEMFKRMTADKGLPVRYGGDEFIILLYNQTEGDAAELAEHIYDEIKDGFRDEIRKKLNKPVDIPEDKKISCSIGIASFKGGSKDAFETALNQADQMLYYVKRHGKSTYKTYH